eukprot:986334-Rhodomonas_salina.1
MSNDVVKWNDLTNRAETALLRKKLCSPVQFFVVKPRTPWPGLFNTVFLKPSTSDFDKCFDRMVFLFVVCIYSIVTVAILNSDFRR